MCRTDARGKLQECQFVLKELLQWSFCEQVRLLHYTKTCVLCQVCVSMELGVNGLRKWLTLCRWQCRASLCRPPCRQSILLSHRDSALALLPHDCTTHLSQCMSLAS